MPSARATGVKVKASYTCIFVKRARARRRRAASGSSYQLLEMRVARTHASRGSTMLRQASSHDVPPGPHFFQVPASCGTGCRWRSSAVCSAGERRVPQPPVLTHSLSSSSPSALASIGWTVPARRHYLFPACCPSQLIGWWILVTRVQVSTEHTQTTFSPKLNCNWISF
jgi:hypothetical protein